MYRISVCIAICIMVAASAAAQPSADFYVAPDGRDDWSGTLAAPAGDASDGPFATVHRARDAVRDLRSAAPDRSEPVVVLVRGGTYFLEQPIVFGPEDSGTEASPVVYRAYPGERPVLSGGQPVTDWQVDPDGRWRASLPAVEAGGWSFAQLFVNDQRRFRPRLPEDGYYRIAEARDASPAAEGQGDDRFGYAPDDLQPHWADGGDIEVLAFLYWSASRLHIRSIDPQTETVTLAAPTWTNEWYGQLEEGHRYLVLNVGESLDDPGEWYLDRENGNLTYLPKSGESPEETSVVAPRLEELLLFEGDVDSENWVEHIEVRGLTLAHTNWTLPDTGQTFPQAEIGLGSAVRAEGARHLVLDRIAVRHTGNYALSFGAGSKYNRVTNCELVDLGGGGIKLGHAGPGSWSSVGQEPAGDAEHVTHHTIRNCTIAHGGRLHPAAVGVWIGHSAHNTVEHNDIYDFYYTGISVGWSWGYQDSPAHHNRIVANHIHDIGQRVLSDMAGVYTLGVSPGTRITGNHIHDVYANDYGGWGLYTDEGSTGIVMARNLVHHTKTGGFHQHYGRDNRITNNIFAFSETDQIQRTRAEDHRSFRFDHNIVYYDEGQLLGMNWDGSGFEMDYNIYWRVDGMPTFPDSLTLASWQHDRGQDRHSIIANPLFLAPYEDDFHLKADSPALRYGFEPFDYERAGRLTDRRLTGDIPPVPPAFD